MVDVVATVIEVGFTIGGDLASFDVQAQSSLQRALRSSLACYEPACFLMLQLSSASIKVNARIIIPQSANGGASGGGASIGGVGISSIAAVTAAARAG